MALKLWFRLLHRGLAELGRRVADEIPPELPGCSSVAGFGFKRMSASSKPLAARVAAKDSSITNTTLAPLSYFHEDTTDAYTVVCRPIGTFRKEHDGRLVRLVLLPDRIRLFPEVENPEGLRRSWKDSWGPLPVTRHVKQPRHNLCTILTQPSSY